MSKSNKRPTQADVANALATAYESDTNQGTALWDAIEVMQRRWGDALPERKEINETAKAYRDQLPQDKAAKTLDNEASIARRLIRLGAFAHIGDVCAAIVGNKSWTGGAVCNRHEMLKAVTCFNKVYKVVDRTPKASEVVAAYFETAPKPAPKDLAESKLKAFLNADSNAKHIKAIREMIQDYCDKNKYDLS